MLGCESSPLSLVWSIEDGALIFHHVVGEEEALCNTCHLIFTKRSRCSHASLLISTVMPLAMNVEDSSRVISQMEVQSHRTL